MPKLHYVHIRLRESSDYMESPPCIFILTPVTMTALTEPDPASLLLS
jgi:hypothetical protein